MDKPLLRSCCGGRCNDEPASMHNHVHSRTPHTSTYSASGSTSQHRVAESQNPTPQASYALSNIIGNGKSSSFRQAHSKDYQVYYSDKVTVNTVEFINDPATPPASVPIVSRKRGCCGYFWPVCLAVTLPLLFLVASSGDVRQSVCSMFLPLPNNQECCNKSLHILEFKRFYHYFLPTPLPPQETVTEKTGLDMSSPSPGVNGEDLLLIQRRMDALESTLKSFQLSFGESVASLRETMYNIESQIGKNGEGRAMELTARMAALKQTVADVEQRYSGRLDEILENQNFYQREFAAIRSKLQMLSEKERSCQEYTSQKDNGDANSVLLSDINQRIADAIARYDADKTGLPDFALEPSGGSILTVRCTETYKGYWRLISVFSIPFWNEVYGPRTVIQPGFSPGECWAFEGSRGTLGIKLSATIRVTAVSYEHIPKTIAVDGRIDSAPKNFVIYGLQSEHDTNGSILGNFTYDADGAALQYFPIQNLDAPPVPIVELQVLDNHGHPLYTCLYRFRVHGKIHRA